MNAVRYRRAELGLTLVELLIALTLGLIIVGALIAVFVASNQNNRQNEAVAVLQDNARFALESLSRDLAMAGYWGGVRPADAGINVRVSATASAAISAGDCGPPAQAAGASWLLSAGTALEFRDHTATAPANTLYRCLDPLTLQADSDIVVIRHVAGQAAFEDGVAPAGALVANRFYVKTNQNIGSLFRASGTDFGTQRSSPADCADGSGTSAPCPPLNLPQQVYAYTPQIYYVRNWLRTRGDQLPILCRRFLNDLVDPPLMDEDCFAEGVENLQIEWGIGSDLSLNPRVVQRYVHNPANDDLRQALTARVHILVRSNAKNVQANQEQKRFKLANYEATLPAGLRRSFTTTVQLKNFQP